MTKPYVPIYFSFILLTLSRAAQGNQYDPFNTPKPCRGRPTEANDTDRVLFAMNLEFLEAEFFLHGALGRGLDSITPYLAKGGPPPVGAQKANLNPFIHRIIEEFGYQEVGHLRAIYTRIGGIQRPLMNLSVHNFAQIMNEAMGEKLDPPFNPYSNSINYVLASYLIPYVGLVGYVGTIPYLSTFNSKSLVAALLGVESGQDAVLRTVLSQRAAEIVIPYGITVAEFTTRISALRNRLAMCGNKDEGIIVPLNLGAENRTTSNVLSANTYSISYSRTPEEILSIVYGTGSEAKPGGFYPNGANGLIATRLRT